MYDEDDDDDDDLQSEEIADAIAEAKNPRRRYKPEFREKQQQKNDVRKWLQKGDRVQFMEALRKAGIKDGSVDFLRAVEAFDRHRKR